MKPLKSGLKILAALSAGACLAASAPSALAAQETVRVIKQKALWHPLGSHHESFEKLQPVKDSEAVLVGSKDGVFVTLSTGDLTPGNVYTMWFAVFNNPKACENDPCNVKDFVGLAAKTKSDVGYGDGIIVGKNGKARFSAYIPTGELSHNWHGNEFTNPLTGEVHLVIHDHGRLIPKLAKDMLNTYRGGCKTETLFEGFSEISKSNGPPGPNRCNLTQIVFFVEPKK